MATLAEAIQNVMAGLEGRRRAQQTVNTARAAQRPGIKLPNTGADPEQDATGGGGSVVATTYTVTDPQTGDVYRISEDYDGNIVKRDLLFQGEEEEIPTIPITKTQQRTFTGRQVGSRADEMPVSRTSLQTQTYNEPANSRDAFLAALSGQLGDADTLTALMAQGFTAGQALDLLQGGGGGGGGGGGSDNTVGLAQIAEQRRQFDLEQARLEREMQIESLFGLVGLETEREARRQANLKAQRDAMMQLTPFMSGGRTHMGGFEDYGAYSAVANFAGVPFNPRPIVEQPIPLGLPEEQDPAQLQQIRALLGV